MPMPKASMDEDDLPTATEDEIRPAWQSGDTEAVPEPHRIDEPADSQFRGSPAAAHSAHERASRLLGKVIHRE